MKLNLGCGRNILEGWVNVDNGTNLQPGVEIADLDGPSPLKGFKNGTVEQFLLSHVLEHLHHPLPLFEDMWRVAKPGARCVVRCPYGSSDDADEDPTHVRRLFVGSFGYFGQPHYWRADYGYRGDWHATHIQLLLHPEFRGKSPMIIYERRNVVREMVAILEAVKPAREPIASLQRAPEVEVIVG